MPVVEGWNAMFLFRDPRPRVDDAEMIHRIIEELKAKGFTATGIGRGNSGIDVGASVSRGRVAIAVWCELSEPKCESQLSLHQQPLWFWQRLLRPAPSQSDVERALAEVRQTADRVLGAYSVVSDIVWRTDGELTAHFKRPAPGNANA